MTETKSVVDTTGAHLVVVDELVSRAVRDDVHVVVVAPEQPVVAVDDDAVSRDDVEFVFGVRGMGIGYADPDMRNDEPTVLNDVEFAFDPTR